MQFRFAKSLLLSASLALTISACNSSSSGDSETVLQGVFLDAPVKGLMYLTSPSGKSGVTDTEGKYDYVAGDTVTFQLGNGTPITLGTVEAKNEVRVTELPQFLNVARALQTLDTDSSPDVIDVSQITFPESLREVLGTLLTEGTGDIESILSDSNIQAIEDASQPAEGSTDSAVDLVNTTVVSVSDAVEHVNGTLLEDFATSDLSKQVYKRLKTDGSLDAVMYLYEDGTGFDAGENTDSTYIENFTGVINADKDFVISYVDGDQDVITGDLLSVNDNEYVVSAINAVTPDEVMITTLLKAKTLTVADLDGKIFSRTSADDDCSAQTFKFSGSTIDVKESCVGGFNQFSVNIAASSDFDNTLVLSGTSPSGEAFSVLFSLIEGELVDGSTMTWATLDAINTENVHFGEIQFVLVDSELEVPPGFSVADLSRQVYVEEAGEMILAFDADGSGVEFNNGDGESGAPYESEMSWSIDSLNRLVVDYDNGEMVTVTLEAVVEDVLMVTVDELGEEDTSTAKFIKALPLSLADLDGKIISFDQSGSEICTAITMKFTGSDVRLSEICSDRTGGTYVINGTVAMSTDYDNVTVVTEPTGEVKMFVLTSGDLDSSGTIAVVGINEFDEVRDVLSSVSFMIVEEEAVPES